MAELVRRVSTHLVRRVSSHSLARGDPGVAHDVAPSPFLSSLECEHAALLARTADCDAPLERSMYSATSSSPTQRLRSSGGRRVEHTRVADGERKQRVGTMPDRLVEHHSNDAFGLVEALTSSESEDENPVQESAARPCRRDPVAADRRRMSWDDDAMDIETAAISARDSGPKSISPQRLHRASSLSSFVPHYSLSGSSQNNHPLPPSSDISASNGSSSMSSRPLGTPDSATTTYTLNATASTNAAPYETWLADPISVNRPQRPVSHRQRKSNGNKLDGEGGCLVKTEVKYSGRMKMGGSLTNRASASEMRTSLVPVERLFPHLANVAYKDTRAVDLFIFLHNGIRAELRDFHKMIDAMRCRIDDPSAGERLRQDVRSLVVWWRDMQRICGAIMDVQEHLLFPWAENMTSLAPGPLSKGARKMHRTKIAKCGADVRGVIGVMAGLPGFHAVGAQDPLLMALARLLRVGNSYSSNLMTYLELTEQHLPDGSLSFFSDVNKRQVEVEIRNWILRGPPSTLSAPRRVKRPTLVLAAIVRWTEDYPHLASIWTAGYLGDKRIRFMYTHMWRRSLHSSHLRQVELVSRP